VLIIIIITLTGFLCAIFVLLALGLILSEMCVIVINT